MKRQAWPAPGLWLAPFAWLLALLGTLLLGDETTRGAGIALILLASVLIVIKYRHITFPPYFAPAEITQQVLPPKPEKAKHRALVTAGIAASTILALAANIRFLASPTDTFGAAGFLWLGGIGLFVVSCLAWSRLSGYVNVPQPERWPAWEKVAFGGLALLAAILRLWDLNNFPYNIFGDEITAGRIAIDSYVGQPGPSIFSLLWENVDLPALWFLTIAKSLELGSFTLWSLRLPAALVGAATAVPLYGFVRLGWGRGAALPATAIYAFSTVALHYSRVNLINIVTAFFWSACFLFLLLGLRSRRPLDWALAGLAGGVSEYGYHATRLLPFILLAFFSYLVLTNRREARYYLGRCGLVALGYFIGFGPLFARYALNPGLYTGRAGGQLIWDHVPVNWEDLQNMVATLWPIMSENLLSISAHSSQDVIYFAPLLLPAEAALLALGVVLLVWHWRQPAAFLVVLTATGVVLTGGTLVLYSVPPYFGHWVPALPAFYVAMSVPLGAWLGEATTRLRGRLKWIPAMMVAAVLFALGCININFYFRDYYANPDTLRDPAYRNAQMRLETRTSQARYQAELGSEYVVRILGEEYYLYNPDVPYLAAGQDYMPLADPGSQLPVARQPDKGLVFLFMPGGEQYRQLVRSTHPGGKEGEISSRTGRHLFYTYILRPEP